MCKTNFFNIIQYACCIAIGIAFMYITLGQTELPTLLLLMLMLFVAIGLSNGNYETSIVSLPTDINVRGQS